MTSKTRPDYTGQRFGRLLVEGPADTTCSPNGRTSWQWRCLCDCGMRRNVRERSLRYGGTRSCGCLREEAIKTPRPRDRRRSPRHGLSRTPEYRAWAEMVKRASAAAGGNSRHYKDRGIMVCERWSSDPAAFVADMGPKPSLAHSLDRIDNDGNYEPSNCRWATKSEQGRNRRTNHLVSFRGRTMTIADWTEAMGFSRTTIRARLVAGWSVEDALTSPQDPNVRRYRRLHRPPT